MSIRGYRVIKQTPYRFRVDQVSYTGVLRTWENNIDPTPDDPARIFDVFFVFNINGDTTNSLYASGHWPTKKEARDDAMRELPAFIEWVTNRDDDGDIQD